MTKEAAAIIPIRLDSYAGETSALEVHFFKGDEYGGKSTPDKSMWIAVHMIDGKIDQGETDYGYESLKELLETYKDHKIIGLNQAKQG